MLWVYTHRRFAMTLPQVLFASGDNHVAMYWLDQGAGHTTLHLIEVRSG